MPGRRRVQLVFDPSDPFGESPLDFLVDAERFCLLRSALKRLPKEERDAVRTIYALDADAPSARKLAGRLGVTTQTIRNRAKQGLSQLRRWLILHGFSPN